MFKFILLLIVLVLITGAVSIALTAVVRSRAFAIFGIIATTELMILIWFYQKTSQSNDPHLMEVLPLPFVMSLIFLPVIAIAAYGFVGLGIRFWASRAKPCNQKDDTGKT